MTTFERIKKLAKMRGYSLTKLNDMAGLGTNSIYHWKNKTPSTDNLKKVATVLNVSVDYLLGNSDSVSSESTPNGTAEVIAAHIDDDTSETEREQIINFIENLKRARKQD